MTGHEIVLFFVLILISTLVGKKIQDKVGIPLPLTLLFVSSLSTVFVHVADVDFSILMMILLPLLLITDALGLKLNELKSKSKSLVYLAFVSVIISVVVGTITMQEFSALPFVFFVVLFSIIMATDAVSVSAVFSKFPQVPHNVKFYAEGESLFNDATAVIIFTLISIPLINGVTPGFLEVTNGALKVVLFSTAIGLGIGYFASYLMKFFDETMDEFLFIPLTAYSAFYIAELLHVSGILAVVSSILIFKDSLMKNLEHFGTDNIVKRMRTTKERLLDNEKLITQLSFIATAVLFISLGSIIHINSVIENISLILIVFAVTTVIRFIMFMYIPIVGIGAIKDAVILTLGGIKGGLAILMVHMIPSSYEYKELIEVVVFGQILLSTFIYVPVMMYLIPKFYSTKNTK